MSVLLTRSTVLAVKEETTEGTLEALTSGADFIPLREGFSITNENEVIDTDTLQDGIGASKSIVVGENPASSIPMYFKHSGTEGTAPEFKVLLESALGTETVNSTEYNTVAGSTVSVLNVDAGEGANFALGQGVLTKDGVNGYAIRNITAINTDALTLNFNLSNAPASGVDLGKAIQYSPASTGHPTYSLYGYQSSSSPAYTEAVAGCRTTGLTVTMPAKDLITMDVEIEGLKYYWKPITIDADNTAVDFTDSSGTVAATLTQKTYKTPEDLADEIATKMTASSAASASDTITCTYSSVTGKYTIASDGSVLSLLWNSGTNAAQSVGTTIGFAVAADDTGALTYLGDNVLSFTVPYTPVYDSSDPNKAVYNQFMIGGVDENYCRPASNVSINIATPKTQALSTCAENGVDSTLILSREVTLSGNILLQPYEVGLFDKAFNNTTTQFMYSAGVKDGSGNWTAGTCINMYMQSASITATNKQDENGYVIVALEAKGFITSSTKDIYINFL